MQLQTNNEVNYTNYKFLFNWSFNPYMRQIASQEFFIVFHLYIKLLFEKGIGL